MRSTAFCRLRRGVSGCSLILMGALALKGAARAGTPSPEPPRVVTRVDSLRRLALQVPATNYDFQLEADLWWANPAQGRFVVHDASGTEEIEAYLPGPPVAGGERVRLTGNGTIVRRGAAFRIGAWEPVVENDGVHSLLEKCGSVYLAAGRQPITVDWFNGGGRLGLSLEFEGAGLPRQPVPDSAVFRPDRNADGQVGRWVNGLEYRCYEGAWSSLPDFSRLTPVKTGNAANLDPRVRTRDANVAVQFTGNLAVPRDGLYRFYLKSDDGSRLFVGQPTLQLTVIGRCALPSPRETAAGQLLPADAEAGFWATVEGKVTAANKRPEGVQLELRAGPGSMSVELGDDAEVSTAQLLNRRIRVKGFCQSAFNLEGERVAGVLLAPGGKDIELLDAALPAESQSSPALPLLTTAGAVRELKPQEARRGYPFRIRGVVTAVQPDRQAFVIQDSTVGLYVVDSAPARFDLPDVGDFLEIGGVTDDPGIARLQWMKHLGRGNLPEPAHPAWGQLMNASLDSQWIEIGGLVENLIDRSNGWTRVMLRTRAGILKVDLRRAGVTPGPLEQYENAVVRMRGCMFADWHPSLRLKVGQIRMYDVEITVDEPAGADVFALPRTTVAALMRFDPTFDASRRVKVAAQVVYVRGADYFTMDGKDGMRFQARQPLDLQAGDLVEAVGFPELSGAAPVLRGAVARKTGQAPLPEPTPLAADDLTRASLDSTRVRVAGLLTGLRQTRTNVVLELQAGSWRFLGRLNTSEAPPALPLGSRLELTGVYCAQGGYQALGADVAQVDVLLNHPADIRVLARPPWWTLPRLLVLVGALACAVALMVLWITQLRRQVEDRTTELAAQIRHREQLEYQRTMEQERARIAQDLHDQLGSDLASISMLAARSRFASAPDEKRSQYLDQVRDTAREMVARLDEIVWAMNPGHDSLSSLENYLGRYAGRFLGLANIAWHFDSPPGAVDCPVDSRQRHQLFLAFREALTNIVRHSRATEVRASLRVEGRELRLAVADNGCGLPPDKPAAEMNGVANMRARIEKLQGQFAITSEPGRGTTVTFSVPLS